MLRHSCSHLVSKTTPNRPHALPPRFAARPALRSRGKAFFLVGVCVKAREPSEPCILLKLRTAARTVARDVQYTMNVFLIRCAQ